MPNSEPNRVDIWLKSADEAFDTSGIVPEARRREIESCANANVARQKCAVWKLLMSAVNTEDAYRDAFGKWHCGDAFFSLTHSGALVAVAVSRHAVGIDIEQERAFSHEDALRRRILAAGEDNADTLHLWTGKEALFKRGEEEYFAPSKYSTATKILRWFDVTHQSRHYLLAVASDEDAVIRIHAEDGILVV